MKVRYTVWTYRGVLVMQADRNSSGIHWTARTPVGDRLMSDTKAGMKALINDKLASK